MHEPISETVREVSQLRNETEATEELSNSVGQKLLELSCLSETPDELKQKQTEFEAIYSQLSDIAQSLITAYKKICSQSHIPRCSASWVTNSKGIKGETEFPLQP